MTENIQIEIIKEEINEIKEEENKVYRLWKHADPPGRLKYLYNNIYDKKITNEIKENSRRYSPKGVEVRDLPIGHFLYGEQGLFATKKFLKYDIIGEYTGKIVPNNVGGHYVAILEDKDYNESLGVDAMDCGNEMRFINSYLNIASRANVKMRTAYINTYPHIVILCIEDIEIGEEILLDYGDEYTNMYLKPPHICESDPVSWNKLPFGDSTSTSSSSSDEDNDNDNNNNDNNNNNETSDRVNDSDKNESNSS